MQDNELDDLFRSKLGGLEVQPSAHVWENIQAELGGVKRKSWIPLYSMAATILVLLAAGTWFLLDKSVKVKQQVAHTQAKVYKAENLKPTQPQLVEHTNAENATVTVPARQSVNNMASVKHRKAVSAHMESMPHQPTVNDVAETNKEPELVLSVLPEKPMTHAVVPEMSLSGTSSIDPSVGSTKVPVSPATVMARQPEVKKKRGIHSLGDLINVVVAKVDKREDKLIEFSDTDDEQSTVTGINLGLIKIKKDK